MNPFAFNQATVLLEQFTRTFIMHIYTGALHHFQGGQMNLVNLATGKHPHVRADQCIETTVNQREPSSYRFVPRAGSAENAAIISTSVFCTPSGNGVG